LKKTILALLLSTSLCAIAQPSLTAQAWLVADDKGNILEGTHTTDVRSIASITKLMTSMVILDSGQSLTETIPRNYTTEHLLDRNCLI